MSLSPFYSIAAARRSLETNTNNRPACNGTIVADTEMGEVIQLQGDQRKDVQEFLTDKKEGLELDAKTIKVCLLSLFSFHKEVHVSNSVPPGPWVLIPSPCLVPVPSSQSMLLCERWE
jgi:hypothetical protein